MPVCIAGMHRSGTSMVARLLRDCGLYLGTEADLVPPAADNPEGFWEHAGIVRINDELLRVLGGGWDLPPALGEGWGQRPEVAALHQQASAVVAAFAGREPWGWKDPRSSIVLPFWQRVVAAPLKVVICLRNPLAVAKSLYRRGFCSDAFGLSLWFAYNQAILSAVPTEHRIVTHYDAYFHDGAAELRRVLEGVGIGCGEGQIRSALAGASLNLRHNQATSDDLLKLNVPEPVLRLYAGLCQEAGPVYQQAARGLCGSAPCRSANAMPAARLRALDNQQSPADTGDTARIARAAVDRLAMQEIEQAHLLLRIAELEPQLRTERARRKQLEQALAGVTQSRAWRTMQAIGGFVYAIAPGLSPLAKPSPPAPQADAAAATKPQTGSTSPLPPCAVAPGRAAIIGLWPGLTSPPPVWHVPALLGQIHRTWWHRRRDPYLPRGWRQWKLPAQDRRAIRSKQRNSGPTPTPTPDPAAPLGPIAAVPLVSIVIPVFNNLAYTRQCVQSMLSARTRCRFEIIVVNNHSTDDTAQWLREAAAQHPRVRFVENPANLGFAAGINAGAAIARGRYLLVANNDILVPDGWLDDLVAAADSDPAVGIVSPVTNHVGEGPQLVHGLVGLSPEKLPEAAQELASRRLPLQRTVDRLVFFCVLIKRPLWDLIGGLSGAYGLGNFEDDDLCLRARLAGFTLAVAPSVFVYHYGSRTFTEQKIPHAQLMEQNRAIFFERMAELSGRPLPGRPPAPHDQQRPPVVSVIVRTMMNRPHLLREALASLANQTFRDFEVVLVSDGGPDAAPVVGSFRPHLDIRYLRHEQPVGRTAALNSGIRAARGQWFNYLDDDDIVYPTHLELLVDATRQHPDTHVVYADVNKALVDEQDGVERVIRRELIDSFEFDRRTLLAENRMPIMSILHSRQCFERIGLFDESLDLLEDWDFWLRLAQVMPFRHLPRATGEYRFRLGEGSQNSIAVRREEALDAIARAYAHHPVDDDAAVRQRRAGVVVLVEQQIRELKAIEALPVDPRRKRRMALHRSALFAPPEAQWIDAKPHRANVCAVVVTYHPDEGFADRLHCFAQQADHVVIVDNASNDAARQRLNDIVQASGGKVELIRNAHNVGVATGLNQGIGRARQLRYGWILSMDQDTIVQPDLVATLGDIYDRCPDRLRVGMLSSNFRDPSLDISVLADDGAEPRYVERMTTVTSGTLLSLSAFHAVGPFRDDLFIDSVDNDYCVRLRACGYKILMSRKLLMTHPIGNARWRRLLVVPLSSSNHPPIRRYYMTRNRIALARLYFGLAPRWNLGELCIMWREVAAVLLLEEDKLAKLRAMALGLWHGLTGVTGKLESQPWER